MLNNMLPQLMIPTISQFKFKVSRMFARIQTENQISRRIKLEILLWWTGYALAFKVIRRWYQRFNDLAPSCGRNKLLALHRLFRRSALLEPREKKSYPILWERIHIHPEILKENCLEDSDSSSRRRRPTAFDAWHRFGLGSSFSLGRMARVKLNALHCGISQRQVLLEYSLEYTVDHLERVRQSRGCTHWYASRSDLRKIRATNHHRGVSNQIKAVQFDHKRIEEADQKFRIRFESVHLILPWHRVNDFLLRYPVRSFPCQTNICVGSVDYIPWFVGSILPGEVS